MCSRSHDNYSSFIRWLKRKNTPWKLTVTAAPMRPCATASPVNCIYREKENYATSSKQVFWFLLYSHFLSAAHWGQRKFRTLLKERDSSLERSNLNVFCLNSSVPALPWRPCWLHPECGYQGRSRCPGSPERNLAASPALLSCTDRSALPASCTSSSSDRRQTEK